MKRILVLLLALILCFCCIGCNSNDKDNENNDTPKTTFEEFECIISKAYYVDNTSIFTNALNADKVAEGTGHAPIYKLDTKQELDQFKQDYSGHINVSEIGVQKFNDAVSLYDDSFFEDFSLLVIYSYGFSSTIKLTGADVNIDGDSLFVNINSECDSDNISDDQTQYIITVTVKKSTIKDCTSFDAK